MEAVIFRNDAELTNVSPFGADYRGTRIFIDCSEETEVVIFEGETDNVIFAGTLFDGKRFIDASL